MATLTAPKSRSSTFSSTSAPPLDAKPSPEQASSLLSLFSNDGVIDPSKLAAARSRYDAARRAEELEAHRDKHQQARQLRRPACGPRAAMDVGDEDGAGADASHRKLLKHNYLIAAGLAGSYGLLPPATTKAAPAAAPQGPASASWLVRGRGAKDDDDDASPAERARQAYLRSVRGAAAARADAVAAGAHEQAATKPAWLEETKARRHLETSD